MATRRSLIQSHTHDLCPFTGNAGTQALIKTKSKHKYCKQDMRFRATAGPLIEGEADRSKIYTEA